VAAAASAGTRRARDLETTAPTATVPGARDAPAVTLDDVSAHWRVALASAREALLAIGRCGTSLRFPELELREWMARLERERIATSRLLEEVAHEARVLLRHHLSAPAATKRMLGLPEHVQACVFDLDGVLTASAEVHASAWRTAFDELLSNRVDRTGERFAPFRPFDPRLDYYAHLHGRPRLDGVYAFLASRGISLPTGTAGDPPGTETVHGLAKRKNEALLAHLEVDGVAAYTGSMWFLEAAREAGMACAVVSASANTGAILEHAGLRDLVTVLVDGRAIAARRLRPKPAPDTVLAACALLAVEPGNAVAFETTVDGIGAANEAGIGLVVAVDRTGRAAGLTAAGADVVVADLDALLDPVLTA
jgi:HAD superfamily hydrolase (TIGR01509 family)